MALPNLEPCGFCGRSTSPYTMLGGMITCEPCLIDEVMTYQQLQAEGVIEQALAMTPKKPEEPQMYVVSFDSYVYNMVHHLATFEVEADSQLDAETWANNRKKLFAERDNAVIRSVKKKEEK